VGVGEKTATVSCIGTARANFLRSLPPLSIPTPRFLGEEKPLHGQGL
jgi:hypothetical protein